MKTSIDISYYPLNQEYKAPIKDFINDLKKHDTIVVKPNNMSTQVFGEYDDIMKAVTTCIRNAFELPDSTFVLKIVNMDRDK